MPAPMPITDSVFLLAESREHPVHVGGLQLFEPPVGAGPEHLGELYRKLLMTEVDARHRRRPVRTLTSLGQWAWVPDHEFDIDYHVRLSALPRPGRVRELLELVSRLHGALLDRHRPLWECHLIDGLQDGRFAIYTKVHHAVNDGVTALARLRRSLSADPAARDQLPPWALGAGSEATGQEGLGHLVDQLLKTPGLLARTAGEALGFGPTVVGALRSALGDDAAALPLQAPRSMLNVRITGARRFAAQSWPMRRVRAVTTATGATVNDVILAMSAGALRRYLLERSALPAKSLIAMVPMSLHAGDSAADGDSEVGNAIGTLLCNLGTDLADAGQRFERIRDSMEQAKAAFAGRSRLQITALSAAIMLPVVAPMLPGGSRFARPPFNIIISNVPGPQVPLYWEGARLSGLYPLSVPMDGQALNITVTTLADQVEFGLTGCRRSVPHLQRMLAYLEDSLTELENVVGAVH